MTNATTTYATAQPGTIIRTTPGITTLVIGRGRIARFPAQVPDVAMTTEDAIRNALDFITPAEIATALLEHHNDADAVGATREQVNFHFVTWLAGFGDWAE